LIIQAPVISLCNRSDLIVTDPYSTEVICSNCCMVISDKFQVIIRLERPAFNTQEMNAKSRTGILTSFAMSFGKCKYITISIED
jgi:hypothetical protein